MFNSLLNSPIVSIPTDLTISKCVSGKGVVIYREHTPTPFRIFKEIRTNNETKEKKKKEEKRENGLYDRTFI